ncbi:MAG: hypothetical protein KAU23_04810 [Anaerolineales bacterium]|nr:hypothetical protein [Anaerolineales bacterium]
MSTGLLQANRSPAFEGLFSFGNAYSTVLAIKHILVVAIIFSPNDGEFDYERRQ